MKFVTNKVIMKKLTKLSNDFRRKASTPQRLKN